MVCRVVWWCQRNPPSPSRKRKRTLYRYPKMAGPYLTACQRCGNDVLNPSIRGRYCSPKCGHDANRDRNGRYDYTQSDRKHRRRQRMYEGAGVTMKQWRAIRLQHEGRCAYCRVPVPLLDRVTYCDHVLPLCRGGNHEPDNVVPCCLPCNLSKGTKTLDEWDLTGDRGRIRPNPHRDPGPGLRARSRINF